jgi:secretion/DNA translocation related CpaE-like protein
LAEASAAAAGCALRVVSDVSQLTVTALRDGAVLIGADRAAAAAGVALPAEVELRLVGTEPEALLAWSMPLGAPTVLLPQQQGFLTALLADETTAGHQAKLLRVYGGSGGVGATTLAAGLAVRAAKRGTKVALVEADVGGGIDLLFAAETEPGWRWSELASARGHIGDLTGRLPRVVGVDLVSVAGLGSPGDATVPNDVTVPADALRAVVASLRRSHDLVVIDQGRRELSEGQPVVVVAGELRGVAAARARLQGAGIGGGMGEAGGGPAGVQPKAVLRLGPGRRLSAALAAEVLEVPVIGEFQYHKRLPYGAEVGDPPGRARGPVAENLDRLLGALLGEPVSTAGGLMAKWRNWLWPI